MLAIAILAAGKGTRMKSKLPKVLHPLAGKSLIDRVLSSTEGLKPSRKLIVVGHQANLVEDSLKNHQNLDFVLQQPQNGTGHAIQQLSSRLKGFNGELLVLNGDVPLLKEETLSSLLKFHKESKASVTFLSSSLESPTGYGRVFTDETGLVKEIIEERDCNDEQRKNKLINAGIYCFKVSWLWENLKKLAPSGNGEIYVTALVSAAFVQGKLIESFEAPKEETLGINTRVQLADAEKKLRNKILEYWMTTGVTITDPSSVYIDVGVEIGLDTVLHPNTHLKGVSKIGKGCEIGPNTIIEASTMGDRCKVTGSVVEGTVMKSNIVVGPYSHLRCGTFIDDNVHIGNFAEVNRSSVGKETRFSHFGYIGDAEISAKVNIGAGTVTCNYDGKRKNKTIISDDVFIGSNTALVAPIKIGKKAVVGAGSTLTKNVREKSLALTRTKQIEIKKYKRK